MKETCLFCVASDFIAFADSVQPCMCVRVRIKEKLNREYVCFAKSDEPSVALFMELNAFLYEGLREQAKEKDD